MSPEMELNILITLLILAYFAAAEKTTGKLQTALSSVLASIPSPPPTWETCHCMCIAMCKSVYPVTSAAMNGPAVVSHRK